MTLKPPYRDQRSVLQKHRPEYLEWFNEELRKAARDKIAKLNNTVKDDLYRALVNYNFAFTSEVSEPDRYGECRMVFYVQRTNGYESRFVVRQDGTLNADNLQTAALDQLQYHATITKQHVIKVSNLAQFGKVVGVSPQEAQVKHDLCDVDVSQERKGYVRIVTSHQHYGFFTTLDVPIKGFEAVVFDLKRCRDVLKNWIDS